MAPANGPIDQIGYLVEDLDASIARWIDRQDVGPWTVYRNVRLEGSYRGEPTVVTIDVGLAYQGEVQIELIQATNTAPSPYRSRSGERLLGIHHIARIVDDLDNEVARATARGMQVAFSARNPATRVAYLESPEDPGAYFEFIEGAGLREMLNLGVAEARTWTGSDPVRVIDLNG